jgi:hypothetical protein
VIADHQKPLGQPAGPTPSAGGADRQHDGTHRG